MLDLAYTRYMFDELPRSRRLVWAHRVVKTSVLVALIAVAWTATAWVVVERAARGRTYSNVSAVPARRVALVLGCSKLLYGRNRNPFFDNRIRAAAQLYRANKVDYLVVSGDNHIHEYDEPSDMKQALVEAGVPADRIYCDYAGFRTLDSVVRVREIFGQTSVIVVSQQFHNQRAIFIGDHRGVEAIGFNAADLGGYYTFKAKCRESAARANMMLDLFVFRRAPKFLGKKVQLPVGGPETT